MTAYAVSSGQEGVMQAVRNFRPWALAYLTRMGDVDQRSTYRRLMDHVRFKFMKYLNSDHYRICVTYCVFILH